MNFACGRRWADRIRTSNCENAFVPSVGKLRVLVGVVCERDGQMCDACVCECISCSGCNCEWSVARKPSDRFVHLSSCSGVKVVREEKKK